MRTAAHKSGPGGVRVRMVWRLVLCLFGHLALLFFLAVYLVFSLNSVQLYTPLANAVEVQLESLHTIPALLGAMDSERRAFEKSHDPRDQALYLQMRQTVEDNLSSLKSPLVLPSPEETQRRALVEKWMTEVGDAGTVPRPGDPVTPEALDARSHALLDELDRLTAHVRGEVRNRQLILQRQEAAEASGRVSFMWAAVSIVSVVTILFQWALAKSIIGPIQTLGQAVQRLQSGDYAARVSLHSGDEIQVLGDSFNVMADNIVRGRQELEQKNTALLDQQEALRNANAGLEQRVDLKTRELEEKNTKLNEAVRMKDEFLATLSHELRTPLMPIISCAHLLNTDARLPVEELKNVQVIDRNARALARMIDELLDLSIVMNRKLRLLRERTEMNSFIRETVETMRSDWEKKQIDVAFIPEAGPVELDIDPMRLAQVITNLMTNAIKYTDPRGRITVRLTSQEEGICIAVTDSGTGLNQHEIDQIFEMFHQSRTSRTRNVGGLGVGLTVARSLAELHGGGLLAESPGPGKGATFTLWLPRMIDAQVVDFASPSLTPLPPAVDRKFLRGRRILLVEDSEDTREALERIFQRRGCYVTTAGSGEEALKQLHHEPPEIIISDLGLPGMSGFEFMTRLRSHAEWKDVIAIALSGLGREQDVQGAVKAGFDAHLLKPVDMAVLDQTLADALQKRVDERDRELFKSQ